MCTTLLYNNNNIMYTAVCGARGSIHLGYIIINGVEKSQGQEKRTIRECLEDRANRFIRNFIDLSQTL
jgi:hypothetical protein